MSSGLACSVRYCGQSRAPCPQRYHVLGIASCPLRLPLLPQWLEIQPEDDEKTRLKKRKLVKSYKSKIRFQKLDSQQREKQSSWLNFQKGKGTKKKAGFFTGARRAHQHLSRRARLAWICRADCLEHGCTSELAHMSRRNGHLLEASPISLYIVRSF